MPENKTLYIATTGKGYVRYGAHASPFWISMFKALEEYFDDPEIAIVRGPSGCEVFRTSAGH